MEMSEITICEKPDWMDFEDILDLLKEAHEAHPEVSYNTDNLTQEELEERLHTGGTVIVALDGDKLVGTFTISLEAVRKWYADGDVARLRYLAVSPSYTRRRIASQMYDACAQWSEEHGVGCLFGSTAYNNTASIKALESNGFYRIDYYWYPNLDHPSICFMRWLNRERPGVLHRNIYYYRRLIMAHGKHWIKMHFCK